MHIATAQATWTSGRRSNSRRNPCDAHSWGPPRAFLRAYLSLAAHHAGACAARERERVRASQICFAVFGDARVNISGCVSQAMQLGGNKRMRLFLRKNGVTNLDQRGSGVSFVSLSRLFREVYPLRLSQAARHEVLELVGEAVPGATDQGHRTAHVRGQGRRGRARGERRTRVFFKQKANFGYIYPYIYISLTQVVAKVVVGGAEGLDAMLSEWGEVPDGASPRHPTRTQSAPELAGSRRPFENSGRNFTVN